MKQVSQKACLLPSGLHRLVLTSPCLLNVAQHALFLILEVGKHVAVLLLDHVWKQQVLSVPAAEGFQLIGFYMDMHL